jgi:CheY-like chemotaxis protein
MDQARILIVDDEEIVRKEFARILQKHGYHVSTAETGFRGLERLLEGSYDLVMTDLARIDINGLAFLTRI